VTDIFIDTSPVAVEEVTSLVSRTVSIGPTLTEEALLSRLSVVDEKVSMTGSRLFSERVLEIGSRSLVFDVDSDSGTEVVLAMKHPNSVKVTTVWFMALVSTFR
jgi:hypothetical protein